jgi:hypothetical protein
MSYQAQDRLANDSEFQARIRACAIGQAEQTYVGATDPADQALAYAVLRYEGMQLLALFQVSASAPGLVDKYEEAGDTSTIADSEILSTVQSYWHDIAISFYNDDGTNKVLGLQFLTPPPPGSFL